MSVKRKTANVRHPDSDELPRVSREQARAWPQSDPRTVEEIEAEYLKQEPRARQSAVEAAVDAVKRGRHSSQGWQPSGREFEAAIHGIMGTSKIIAQHDSQQHSKSAKAPRPNALQTRIEDIVKQEPSLTWKQVLKKLEGTAAKGVVVRVNNKKGMVNWRDRSGRRGSTPVSALASRVSRAKKTL
jgi:hypothetical protein